MYYIINNHIIVLQIKINIFFVRKKSPHKGEKKGEMGLKGTQKTWICKKIFIS